MALTGNITEAEDILHDVFLNFARSLARIFHAISMVRTSAMALVLLS
jgi:DNA-directed RNA polymerase specialized sigma24 family protein